MAVFLEIELADVDPAGLGGFGKALGSLAEEHRGIGFWDEEGAEKPHCTCEACEKPFDPAPTNILAYVTTDDWTKSRADKRGNDKSAHCQADETRAVHIRYLGPSVGEWRRAGYASEEAENQ